jgi:hypothetical protein
MHRDKTRVLNGLPKRLRTAAPTSSVNLLFLSGDAIASTERRIIAPPQQAGTQERPCNAAADDLPPSGCNAGNIYAIVEEFL